MHGDQLFLMEVLVGHFDDRFQLFRRDFALVDKNREDRKCQIEEVQLLRGIVFPNILRSTC